MKLIAITLLCVTCISCNTSIKTQYYEFKPITIKPRIQVIEFKQPHVIKGVRHE